MNLDCIITDDEPIALEILEDYIKKVPDLRLLAKCRNARETLSVMRNHHTDILFIDIKMPEITGIELVKSLPNRPAVIFTTAYPNYAVDGFDLEAVDYLLKPISLERFLRAVNKVFGLMSSPPGSGQGLRTSSEKDFIFVKTSGGLQKVNYREIVLLESLQNYVRIQLKQKVIVTCSTMKSIEQVLPRDLFLRVHRSFIVNLQHVESLHEHLFRLGDKSVLIGKTYRKAVMEQLRSQNLCLDRNIPLGDLP
jgi:two-component system LytT family response regulator